MRKESVALMLKQKIIRNCGAGEKACDIINGERELGGGGYGGGKGEVCDIINGKREIGGGGGS